MPISKTPAHSIISTDPWLVPYENAIRERALRVHHQLNRLLNGEMTLRDFASGHEYFGLHMRDGAWVMRERAPNASRIFVVGDFSNWEIRPQFEMLRLSQGVWELVIPADTLRHGMLYKLLVYWNENGREVCAERIPSFCRRAVQDPDSLVFSAQVWAPKDSYSWRCPHFIVPSSAPHIYEAHVGMAQEEAKVGSYAEFSRKIIPRIAQSGYNTIQLMAVQEHPYYGSFGYQVSNFFAPSSRFGTPEDLMELVDTAHSYGLAVIMDIVHSHAVKNENEGLSKLDGTYTLYFHEGERGEHPAWNTRLFDYGKTETLHFLLSNCRYWLDTYRFDGFRFDGVTSMIYRDHGLSSSATSYDYYFGDNIDEDAIVYLAIANRLIHELRPDSISIAEEVSGLPGLAAPGSRLGVGFDYRLAMGVPDYWIKLLKHVRDEHWNVSEIWRELTSKRIDERTIGYCESHDQALVGDKTLIFWLADKEMYWHMQVDDSNLVIDRAIALHKIIRLLTLATAGNGYLNFIGNEFGHPEWIDFPRAGNSWSYSYARRQWSLRDNQDLKYKYLAEFDRAMLEISSRHGLLEEKWPHKHYEHVDDQLLIFERAGLLFVFNLHPHNSYADRTFACKPGRYSVVLDSDAAEFGGFERIDSSMVYNVDGKDNQMRLYIPSRSAIVLRLEQTV